MCDYVIAPVARYAGVWKMPVLTAGAQAENFNYREEYPTLTRMMGSYKLVGEALREILQGFGWKVAGLMYYNHGMHSPMGHSKCHFTTSAVFVALGQRPEYRSFNDTADRAAFKDLLTVLSAHARSECPSRRDLPFSVVGDRWSRRTEPDRSGRFCSDISRGDSDMPARKAIRVENDNVVTFVWIVKNTRTINVFRTSPGRFF